MNKKQIQIISVKSRNQPNQKQINKSYISPTNCKVLPIKKHIPQDKSDLKILKNETEIKNIWKSYIHEPLLNTKKDTIKLHEKIHKNYQILFRSHTPEKFSKNICSKVPISDNLDNVEEKIEISEKYFFTIKMRKKIFL